ncbi:hypothetical protein VM1G_11497 [Cytospora mali]|uniref:Uncharacterized protein n=1 Tax=Cytospora mali TaxID=578113 RepID=A0A194VTY4_CYTMA|nr:hypothetical protein VM1G_11497 [Valsa mali]
MTESSGAVDLPSRTVAYVWADGVVEDLAQGEEDGGQGQVDHGPGLTQYPQHQNGLEDVEDDEEDERRKLVQHVQGNIPVLGAVVARCELLRPTIACVEGDITSSDEKDRCRGHYQA